MAASALVACSGVIGAPGSDGEPSPSSPPVDDTPLDPSRGLLCDEAASRPGGARLWRLTHTQYARAAGQLLGLGDVSETVEFVSASAGESFSNEADLLRVRDNEAGDYRRNARALAEQALREGTLAARWPCIEEAGAPCEAFVAELGRAAFRRPLTDAERARYEGLYALAERELGTAGAGAQAVAEAMLQSPSFLFRSELGAPDARAGDAALTDHELATALAFTLTDAPPDAELAAAADAGALTEPGALEAQIDRLLGDPRWADVQRRFLRELLGVDHLDALEKDPDTFPDFPRLRPLFAAELEEQLDRVLDGGSLADLFHDPVAPSDAELAAFYGAEDGAVPEERAGLLRRGAFLAAHSGNGSTSPISRGLWLRTRLLCDVIPPPPPGAATSLPEPEPGMSRRELIEDATATGGCATCHGRMNDLGFAFDEYDAAGALRTHDDLGQPIVTAGTLSDTQDLDGPFEDLPALMGRLAESQQVADCMGIQALHFASGRAPGEGDACTVAEMVEAASADGELDFGRLLASYFRSDAFRLRHRGEE